MPKSASAKMRLHEKSELQKNQLNRGGGVLQPQ